MRSVVKSEYKDTSNSMYGKAAPWTVERNKANKGKTYEEMYGPKLALRLKSALSLRSRKMWRMPGARKKMSEALRGKRPNISGSLHPNWRGGISKDPYPFVFNEILKESIRERDGHQCVDCGCSDMANGRKLVIHHIDYNKQNCHGDNLVTLCLACNSKANYKRDDWMKHFQALVKRKQLTLKQKVGDKS